LHFQREYYFDASDYQANFREGYSTKKTVWAWSDGPKFGRSSTDTDGDWDGVSANKLR
jgi:hypothetical protein